MKRLTVIGALGAAIVATPVPAQQTYYWPAPASSAQTTHRLYFPMGTPIALRTRTEVNTKQSKPGDRFYLEVAESLVYRGQVVLPAGAPAVAEVVRAEKNGVLGKKGIIEARLLYVETPSGQVRLSGRTSDEGTGARVWSIGGAVLMAWPLALIHGTSGYIRNGTAVTAQLAQDLSFAANPPSASGIAYAVPATRVVPASFDTAAVGGE